LKTIINLGLGPKFNTVLEFSPQEIPSIPDMTPLSINRAKCVYLFKKSQESEY
jgi:hypothetical protein